MRPGKQQKLDDLFMLEAWINSTRSTCRRPVGAVLAIENYRISDGFNDTPKGYPNCGEGGCPRCNDPTIPSGVDLDKCICIHAEDNSFFNAKGPVVGSSLYVTLAPCTGCAKHSMQNEIKRIVYDDEISYPRKEEVLAFLKRGGIEVVPYIMDSQRKKLILYVARTKQPSLEEMLKRMQG